jgi:toxin ParE1/3/4
VRRLRFTLPAAKQIDRVFDYIEERNPQGARNVQTRIQQMMHLLLEHPNAGSATSRSGMRRIVVFPFPYAIFYRVSDDEIIIHGVRHTARRPIA